MNTAYAPYNPYAAFAAAPVAAPTAAMAPYYAPAMVAFGAADPNAPAQPSFLDKTKAFLQTPSVGGLSRGSLLAIGVAGATLLYGANTHWFGFAEKHAKRDPGRRHHRHHRHY